MDSIERSARTVEEAVKEALRELGVGAERAGVEVLSPGSKGFLGIGSKPAKVRVTVVFDPERIARDFLTKIVNAVGLKITLDIKKNDKQMEIMMYGQDIGILIGKRGHTLDSLQHLLSLVINKGNAPYVNIMLDAEHYRSKRKQTLESLAHNLVRKAKSTHKKIVLEPMSPADRRIIHATLQHDRAVDTYSEGNEPHRYVVISPKV